MRVADYLWEALHRIGVRYVFMQQGGGMMYLADALLDSKLKSVSFHHEQGAAYAAVGYGKYSGMPCVAMGTSGCGGTNMMTPLLAAWQDSVPVFFVQGQDNTERTKNFTGNNKRQVGIQEADVIPMVKSITGYAKQLNDIQTANDDIDLAIVRMSLARKSPVWVTIPLDIQCGKLSL